MSLIRCKNHLGVTVENPSEKFTFRPCAYGLVVKDGMILVMKNKHNGNYWFPGGGINIDERMEEGLVREVQEETRTHIKILKQLFIKEWFFFYSPEDAGYNTIAFFFLCQPETLPEVIHEAETDPDLLEAEWIPIRELTPDRISDLSDLGDVAMTICEYLQKLI